MRSVCKHDHDCEFEMELGLQNTRRTLIQMLDDFEAEDCVRCRQLKCRCDQTGLTPPRSPTSSQSGSDPKVIALPASSLPRPEFKTSSEKNDPPTPTYDVEAWVRASTPNPEKTESPGCKPIGHIDQLSWPPAQKSIWNGYKTIKPEINTSTISQASNVEEFFRPFRARHGLYDAANRDAYEMNRLLMQQLKLIAETQQAQMKAAEYTYF